MTDCQILEQGTEAAKVTESVGCQRSCLRARVLSSYFDLTTFLVLGGGCVVYLKSPGRVCGLFPLFSRTETPSTCCVHSGSTPQLGLTNEEDKSVVYESSLKLPGTWIADAGCGKGVKGVDAAWDGL